MNRSQTQPDVMAKIRSERGLAMRIAEACGISRSAVYQWSEVPAARVMIVAPLVRMKPEHIRPDVFGKPKA
jgi:hypothetical protein